MKNTKVINVLTDEQKSELKNCVNIDWLSLNFKNITADILLELFCQSTSQSEISQENFILQDRGFVTGYTHSYSYLGFSYIVVSFCPTRAEMGINLQITGTGCKLVYFEDILRFLDLVSVVTKDFKCNRLDLAYDDFEKVIPVEEMIQATEKELDVKSGIRTMTTRIKRNMISIYTNHWNGITSKNLVFGKHRSARSFRLYDKKLEQKRTDLDYWYRLEIELRTKGKSHNADIAFKEFLQGKSPFEIFLDNISSMITFTVPYSSINGNSTRCNISSEYWEKFISTLNTQLRIICIMRSWVFKSKLK